MKLMLSIRGNPNNRAMNRQRSTDETDQYQFSKQTSENKRSEQSEYLMQSSIRSFSEILYHIEFIIMVSGWRLVTQMLGLPQLVSSLEKYCFKPR
jgi:hypothetical protein